VESYLFIIFWLYFAFPRAANTDANWIHCLRLSCFLCTNCEQNGCRCDWCGMKRGRMMPEACSDRRRRAADAVLQNVTEAWATTVSVFAGL